jgi:HAMP domain-containing protein
MRHLDMKTKQTTAWPWLAGLVILGLVVWAATSLLAAPVEELESAGEAAAEEELSPAVLPMPANPIGITPVHDTRELAPLSEDHVGQRVTAEGEVLATGTAGFWILAGSEVIRVDSEQVVRRGQTVRVHGTLRADDPGPTDRIAEEVISRSPMAGDWRVVHGVKLVEEEEEEPATPATLEDPVGGET